MQHKTLRLPFLITQGSEVWITDLLVGRRHNIQDIALHEHILIHSISFPTVGLTTGFTQLVGAEFKMLPSLQGHRAYRT